MGSAPKYERKYRTLSLVLLTFALPATLLAIGCSVKIPDVFSYPAEDLPQAAGDIQWPDGWSTDWTMPDKDTFTGKDTQWHPPFPQLDIGPFGDQNEGDTIPEDLTYDVDEPPPIWECWLTEYDEEAGRAVKLDYLPQDFPTGIHTSSFHYTAVGLGKNVANPSYYTCGMDDYNDQKEETNFIVQVDNFVSLTVDVQCNGTCYVYLMKNGCMYDHLEQCLFNDSEQLHLDADLLPGTYLVGVEFLKQKDLTVEELAFDIRVAMNKTEGQTPCNVESHSFASEALPFCDVKPGIQQLPIVVSGELDWMDKDDFYLTCDHFGTPADPTGGMPDTVHSLEADFAAAGLVKVDVSLKLLDPMQGDGHTLALTTAPCGASAAIVDCAWGVESDLTIQSVSLFPGETVYAVVDGLATSNAWNTPRPYDLTWTVHTPCD